MADLSEQETQLAISLALGCAAASMESDDDFTTKPEIQALWPEGLSADALTIAAQAALTLATLLEIPSERVGAVATALMPE